MCFSHGTHQSMCPFTCKWFIRVGGIKDDITHCIFTLPITMHLSLLTMSNPCYQPLVRPSHGMKGNCGPYLMAFISWVGFIANTFAHQTLSLHRSKLLQHICVLLKGMHQSKAHSHAYGLWSWELLGLIHFIISSHCTLWCIFIQLSCLPPLLASFSPLINIAMNVWALSPPICELNSWSSGYIPKKLCTNGLLQYLCIY